MIKQSGPQDAKQWRTFNSPGVLQPGAGGSRKESPDRTASDVRETYAGRGWRYKCAKALKPSAADSRTLSGSAIFNFHLREASTIAMSLNDENLSTLGYSSDEEGTSVLVCISLHLQLGPRAESRFASLDRGSSSNDNASIADSMCDAYNEHLKARRRKYPEAGGKVCFERVSGLSTQSGYKSVYEDLSEMPWASDEFLLQETASILEQSVGSVPSDKRSGLAECSPSGVRDVVKPELIAALKKAPAFTLGIESEMDPSRRLRLGTSTAKQARPHIRWRRSMKAEGQSGVIEDAVKRLCKGNKYVHFNPAERMIALGRVKDCLAVHLAGHLNNPDIIWPRNAAAHDILQGCGGEISEAECEEIAQLILKAL